ncbi:hypothetical protein KIW84_040745 [Lathyrus oleraceus]|uniref:RING-type domain-containing protein n=1 Tax=Pisum sativum TaxID=3888 RepID=A0A9D5ANF7_PEA|nr:hypothetical protein KIW84_040745 [Pisum sativum]
MNPFHPSPEACDCCGVTPTSPLFLHTISYRAINRRFCTNCVLKQQQGTFCPICFELFNDSFIPNIHLMCIRCPSIAHRSCVLPSSTPDFAFLCPACADPNFSYFKVDRRGIDFHANKVLAAAAQISANTLTRAAVAIRLDAERRAMVAVGARKKAIEALELFADVAAKEQEEGSSEQEDDSEQSQISHSLLFLERRQMFVCIKGFAVVL